MESQINKFPCGYQTFSILQFEASFCLNIFIILVQNFNISQHLVRTKMTMTILAYSKLPKIALLTLYYRAFQKKRLKSPVSEELLYLLIHVMDLQTVVLQALLVEQGLTVC